MQAAADDQTFPTITASKAEVVDAVVAWVHEAIAQDRKIGALKQLQGHVWRSGFEKGQLTAELFRWGGWLGDSILPLTDTGVCGLKPTGAVCKKSSHLTCCQDDSD